MNLTQHIQNTDDAQCPFQQRVSENTIVAQEVYDSADEVAELAQIARKAVEALRMAEQKHAAIKARAKTFHVDGPIVVRRDDNGPAEVLPPVATQPVSQAEEEYAQIQRFAERDKAIETLTKYCEERLKCPTQR